MQYPINALHKDGETLLIYTEQELRKFISSHLVGEYFTSSAYDHTYGWWLVSKPAEWILRDDFGKCVDPNNFKPIYKRRVNKQLLIAIEKGLPIPYTGCSKAYGTNAMAKKNSGSRKRQVLRSLAEEHRKEYGLRNPYGKPKPYEHW